MAEQMRPASNKQAPNPAHSYERADPNREAGMGKLDGEEGTPIDQQDDKDHGVPNKQPEHRKKES